ncbi:hypothetical protein DEU56DRAFT_824254 [Suillus clintonianus]|uniref:uncharacterized protein n=1 Tax=Suillus clintonianus TaxID=1904413 RepID=UPI001B87F043|nr:uncharacterized protein DEU56DRAFT_824254 [Suillus clintonianus]KAG2125759.1 hypothetical protein DEU56DRAFT_824254 [Suillus clintonianus]
MTSTTSNASTARNVPPFPPELWLKIFSLATDVPGLLSCDGPTPSDLPLSLVKEHEHGLLKESLITKRNIVLVSRTWHALATEFLYRSVLVTHPATLSSLLATLNSRPSGAALSAHVGWWTRRLDVLMQDDRCEATDYALLANIIRRFPNLSIVNLSMPMLPYNDCWLRQLPQSVVMALAESCGPSLRVFDCSESILRPCREDLMTLIAAAPNLSVLRCPICSPSAGDKSPSARLDVPVMTKLQSVSLMSVFLRDYLPDDRNANHFPALRKLTYDCIPPPFLDHTWKHFVKLSCANVTTVHLDYSLQADSLQKELDLLGECCSSLNDLVIYIRSWTEIKPNLTLPPSVSYLGLHSKLREAPAFHFKQLFAALRTISGSKLNTVRLLHADTVEDLRENHRSLLESELADSASSITFRIEDHEGHLLLA